MRNKIFAIAILSICIATTASAQNSADATVEASATIVTPISITAGDNMSFGYIVASVAGGTVAVDSIGGLIGTGVTVHSSSVGSAASFDVAGESGYTYDITLPSPFDLTGPALSTPMSVGSFVKSYGAGTLTGGAETFKVWATLTVGANQASGYYENATDFTVTVNYN